VTGSGCVVVSQTARPVRQARRGVTLRCSPAADGGGWQNTGVPPTQYSQSGGFLVAIGAMVVLVLLCRWVFSTSERDERTARRLRAVRSRGDYGLLVPVATVRTRDDAALLREVLADAGIRGTVADGTVPGELAVLVFRADAERARSLVSS